MLGFLADIKIFLFLWYNNYCSFKELLFEKHFEFLNQHISDNKLWCNWSWAYIQDIHNCIHYPLKSTLNTP